MALVVAGCYLSRMPTAPGEVLTEVLCRLWPGEQLRSEPLSGGITNFNFRVFLEDRSVVVRVPGGRTELLGIDRHAEASANALAAGIGVAPEIVAFDEATGCIVTLFVEGRPVGTDALGAEPMLGEVVAALHRVHGAGQVQALFDPFAVVAGYHREITSRGAREPFAYEKMAALLDQVAKVCPVEPSALGHNDLLNSNLIYDGTVRILDWEYAGMTDPFFDLANFSSNNELGDERDEAILRHYFGQASSQSIAKLRLMKLVSEAREAMWGALQHVISDLEMDFASYGAERAERFFALAERLDLGSLLSAAAR